LKLTLNGWRRLGIVLVALWITGVLAVVILELSYSVKSGTFVYQSIPAGTVIEPGKVYLPDGRIIPIDDIDPTTGRRLPPWEVDWSKQTEVPSITNIRWLRLSLVTLLIPTIAWIVAELAVVIAAWVVRGFKNRSG